MNHHALRLCTFLLLVATLGFSGVAQAQPWYWPKAFGTSLQIQNPSNQDSVIAFQVPDGSGAAAFFTVSVPAGGLQTVNWPEDWLTELIQIESPYELSLTIRSGEQVLVSGFSDRVQGEIGFGESTKSYRVQIFNLSSQEQTHLKLRTEDFLGLGHEEQLPTLGAHASLTWTVTLPPGGHWAVQGDYALTAVLGELASPAAPVRSELHLNPDPSFRYFLLVGIDTTKSYVLPLKDPEQIKAALAEISGQLSKQIWTAAIQQGHGNQNRNLQNPNRPVWSWSVSEAVEHGSFAPESCNGDAQYVEDHLLEWLQTHRGICFWSYHILREISLQELQ